MDSGQKIVVQLGDLADHLNNLTSMIKAIGQHQIQTAKQVAKQSAPIATLQLDSELQQQLSQLQQVQQQIEDNKEQTPTPTPVNVINQPLPGLDHLLKALINTLEVSLVPVVRSMDRKIDIDLRTHDNLLEISEQLKALEQQMGVQ